MLQTLREPIARVRDLVVTWEPATETAAIYRGEWQGFAADHPLFVVRGEDARRLGAAVVVSHMRGGPDAVLALLREVFDPTMGSASIADGIYYAERNAYRRVNGRIVRDMES